MSKAVRKKDSLAAMPRALECFVVKDSEWDETPDGAEMFFSAPEGIKPAPVPVRLTIAANIRPANLIRRRGRWCMTFDLLDMEDEEEPAMLAVECGEGGPLSLEEAAQLFFGGEVAT